MSIYTTQLRWIVERKMYESHSSDYSACYAYLGLDSYPIFDESYRPILNDKIIRHFYFREIGFETAAQFAFFMRRTMDENMPLFNKYYETEGFVIDPLTNKKYGWRETYSMNQEGAGSEASTGSKNTTLGRVDGTNETMTYGKTDTDVRDYGRRDDSTTTTEFGHTVGTVNGGSDTNTEGAVHEREIHSDTPMNQISNEGVHNLNYATDVTYNDREQVTGNVTEYGGTTNTTNGGSDTTIGATVSGGRDTDTRTLGGSDTRSNAFTRTDTGAESNTGEVHSTKDLDETGEREHTVEGYDGVSPALLLKEWRETFINVDMMVINSLEKLFFGLWN